MAEKQGTAAKPARPTITLPPKPSMDTMLGLHSPGPMTLVSSFFSDYNPESADFRSFSQLLAGAMNSPLALMASAPNQFNLDATWEKPSSEVKSGDGGEKNPGYKQSRPTNLAVVQSPMFNVPPGLSPSGLLYSPSFFCQSPFGMSHQQALAQVTAQAALGQSQTQMETETSIPNPTEPIPPPSSLPVISIPEPSDIGNPAPGPVDKPSEDGYNWRKYGQKQVKGCEYPRSYYKCTYLNCPVRKKVERAHDGRITEIIYKGQHNHELPQNNKRGKDCGGPGGGTGSQAKVEVVQEFAQLAATAHTSVSTDNEDADDAETITVGEDADDDEPNAKRRNVEAGPPPEVVSSHKTVTEPKIIVQTRSEVDLLDDGYRWRKYGQKVVKGNPHPRSYYKCTFAGCNVRKHVERAAADPKAVITTYEGKHKHTVPGARNSSHTAPAANTNLHKPNAQKPVAENNRFLGQRPAVLRLKEERVAS